MCFSLLWFFQLLVWFVIISAIVSVLYVLVPWALAQFPGVNVAPVLAILRIIIGAIILITVIWFIYDLLVCVGTFPRMIR
jgi:hypothetical protein